MTDLSLILIIIAGALLGVFVGKLPRTVIYVAVAVVLIAAIVVLRGST